MYTSGPSDNTRIERDFLGEKAVPADAYWGIQTQRAVENFPISGHGPDPTFVRATVLVKKAAALANKKCGVLDARLADAIVAAADEVLDDGLADQFVVDVYQAGAGTSHHMNVNEVLANRANELLGAARGAYDPIHPNNHVNYGQSTNDVIPTAIRIASLMMLKDLYAALDALAAALARKAREFGQIVKSGRTHMQDATPVTLGQEFGAWAKTIRRQIDHLHKAADMLLPLGIGGSAVGSGLNTARGYREQVVEQLARLTGLPLTSAPDLFEAMQSMGPMTALSGALRNLAVELGRIAADLRLLSSGPRTGLAEITLPEVQPGSSIMPGKINPVIAEMTEMVCSRVMGNDVTIGIAARGGQLELNVMMPLIAAVLCESLQILTNAVRTLTTRCIDGIAADAERCRDYAERSVALPTVLNPILGYHAVAKVVRESLATGKSPREIIRERKLLPPDEIERVFSAAAMANVNLEHEGADEAVE